MSSTFVERTDHLCSQIDQLLALAKKAGYKIETSEEYYDLPEPERRKVFCEYLDNNETMASRMDDDSSCFPSW